MDALSEAYAAARDAADELAGFRAEFSAAEPGLIYLDGNSLGRPPRRAAAQVRAAVETAWSQRLIRGWNDGWFTAGQRLGARLAPLIGAGPDEVLFADSTSVNLFKLPWPACAPAPAGPSSSPTT